MALKIYHVEQASFLVRFVETEQKAALYASVVTEGRGVAHAACAGTELAHKVEDEQAMGLLLVQVSGVGGVNVVHNVIVVERGAPERQLVITEDSL